MVDIAFPIKGLDTTHARYAQPDMTSPDMLNVFPFDRDYRVRGSVRPGTSKFLSTQLGGGAPITLLDQITQALDPSVIVPSTQILSATFVGTDGTGVGTIGGSGVTWRCSSGGAGFFPFATVSDTALEIHTNTAIQNGASTGTANAALYVPVLTLGAAYILEAVVNISNVSTSLNVAEAYGIVSRIDTGTFAQQGLCLYVNCFGCKIRNDNGSIASSEFDFATPLAAGNHTIQLRVSGDVLTGWVDGVQYVTLTTTLHNTFSGFGFWVGKLYDNTTTGVSQFNVYTGAPLASFRKTSVVAVSNGSIYVGDTSGIAVTSGGTGVLSTTIKPRMGYSKGTCYFVDSVHNCKQLTLSNLTTADISPTAGSETAATLGAYSLACIWRDRLVLAASAATPQNFIMSRQAITPSTNIDFDYSQTDAAAAVAGNASKAGAIGDPLNALIPWTDDVLILGGDHTIYQVQGDIAAGGQILLVSDSIGTLGADCWDTDPVGNLYFVGTGGLYRMAPGGQPQNVANESVRNVFAKIDRTTTYIVLTWDRDRNGLFIHMTPVNTGIATHYFWDATGGGFFPIQYPNTHGPITAIVFDGDGPVDRQLLLGSRDGYIRKHDPSSLNDDGTDITSYVNIGPMRPSGDASLSVLEAMEIMLGDAPVGFTGSGTSSQFGMTLAVSTGKDVYTLLNNPERTLSFTFTAQSRQKRLLQRLSGGDFMFKISGVSGKLWSLEKLVALFIPGGLQRRH